MSGYLQRLVSSARAPSETIRPVLGSLFSASTYESAPESFEAVEHNVINDRGKFPAALNLQPARAIQSALKPYSTPDLLNSHTQTPTGQGSAQSGGATPSPEGRTFLMPLVHEVPQDTGPIIKEEGARPIAEARMSFASLVTKASQETNPTRKTNGEYGLSEEPIEPPQPRLERTDQPAIPRRPYSPLMSEDLPRKDANIFQDSRPLTSDVRRVEKTDSSRSTARPDGDANEIQIHIGRIEVTAVPPTPVRPAAPLPRKFLRLDEYLRGRHGRAL